MKTVRMLMFFQGTAINFFRAVFILQMLILLYLKLISIGEFLSLFLYSFFLFSPLGEIGNVVSKYAETRASLENVERILAQEPAPTNPGGAVPDGIESLEFAGVTYRHPGAREPALQDVSFSARSGESIAFVGPSGAGKSTLIKLLLGLYRPDSGRIVFNGVESQDINYDLLRTRVGFVPQSIELFAGTIRDNLRFVRQEATDEECMASLEAAQLKGLLERSREGLDTRIGEGGLKLSGGERQRLAIARALLRRAGPSHLRRGDQLPGYGDGERDHAHHRRDHHDPTELRHPPHRAPPVHGGGGGPHRRAEKGPGGRAGIPPGAPAQEGPLLCPLAAAGPGARRPDASDGRAGRIAVRPR